MEILREVGLTDNEARVYVALNELGLSTIGPIVDKAGISNSKIYIVLEKLVKKGLVSHVLKNNVKHYKVGEPQRLLDFLEQKKSAITEQEHKINALIPALLASRKHATREVEVFEGFNGLKAVRERALLSLRRGDELLVLGASRFSTSQYEHYWENFHRRRIALGIKCRFIMEHETRSNQGKRRSSWKLTRVRYMPRGASQPMRVDIYGNHVDIAIDAVDPFVISIKSEEISASFRGYFEMLWSSTRA
jgi:HTH-type transcriptional regulator, sugar sensing transcriptional regulator